MTHNRYRGVNFHAIWDKGTVEFRWFESTLHAGKVKAYVQFILALVTKARTARAATSRRRTFNPACARYDWRVFLLRLGLIGPEFTTARKFLLALMPGDAAFKHGRPPKPPTSSVDTPLPAPSPTAARGGASLPPLDTSP